MAEEADLAISPAAVTSIVHNVIMPSVTRHVASTVIADPHFVPPNGRGKKKLARSFFLSLNITAGWRKFKNKPKRPLLCPLEIK